MSSDTTAALRPAFEAVRERSRDRRVAAWLFTVAGLIFVMVLLGGATRLTGSGLSIVEWRPVTGVLPPLSETAWAEEFAKYQRHPEFRLVNSWMTLADFKGIFWLEYLHRLLGRLIGAVFFIPFLAFYAKGWLRRSLVGPLAGIFILGGLQGALGWFMVQSGLVSEPAVSHYRLAAHLGLALLLYGAILWTGLGLWTPRRHRAHPIELGRPAVLLIILVFAQMLLGALVAGLDAGYIYNSWPKMGDGWLPEGGLTLVPVWRNFLDNGAMVQFEHRILAYAITLFVLWVLWRAWRLRRTVPWRALGIVAAVCILQVVLGIATVTAGTPVLLGVAHQGGALLLLTAALLLYHRVRIA